MSDACVGSYRQKSRQTDAYCCLHTRCSHDRELAMFTLTFKNEKISFLSFDKIASSLKGVKGRLCQEKKYATEV